MKDQYKLVGFLHPVGQGHSFLVPVLLCNNKFWMQDISDDNKILEFRQLLLSGYILPFHGATYLQQGSEALFAFYTGGGTVLSGVKEALAGHLFRWSKTARMSLATARVVAEFLGKNKIFEQTLSKMVAADRAVLSKNASAEKVLSAPMAALPDLMARQREIFDANLRSASHIAQLSANAAAQLLGGFDSFFAVQRELVQQLVEFGFFKQDNASDRANSLALVKSAMVAASNAFEEVQKAARQAADIAATMKEELPKRDSGLRPNTRKRTVGE